MGTDVLEAAVEAADVRASWVGKLTDVQLWQMLKHLEATAPYVKPGSDEDIWGFKKAALSAKHGGAELCPCYRAPNMKKLESTPVGLFQSFLCARCGRSTFDHDTADEPLVAEKQKKATAREAAARPPRPTQHTAVAAAPPTRSVPFRQPAPPRDPLMLDNLNDPLALAVGSYGVGGGGESERADLCAAQRTTTVPTAPHSAAMSLPPEPSPSLSALAIDDNAAWKAEVERMVQASLPGAATPPANRPPAAAAAAPSTLDDEETLLLKQLEAIRAKKAAVGAAHAAR